jgi:hypothetical protein
VQWARTGEGERARGGGGGHTLRGGDGVSALVLAEHVPRPCRRALLSVRQLQPAPSPQSPRVNGRDTYIRAVR